MDWLTDPQGWIALLTLTALEIVLGIDNVVFISILADKLPVERRQLARRTGLLLAMVTRILLLFSLSWLIGLTTPLFRIATVDFTGRSLILILGGLFLLGKATYEIHEKLEGQEHDKGAIANVTFSSVIIQILMLDIVFSLDSVITAVGMVDELAIMIIAVVIAILIMLWAAEPISAFVNERPTVKMLALSFLLLIGFSLVAEGFEVHIPKGYIYFAMGFSIFVEYLNIRIRGRGEPVKLHNVPMKEK
ncbi:MAG TPA: TerC family protein [Anaerolineales bacterium]|nr:TerC family protein [Anaerolineales bacterium]